MPMSNSLRLANFTRLIALGYPPAPAAKGARFCGLRDSRADRRLATPKTKAAAASDPRPPRPPLPPMMTEEEWLAEFAPLMRDKRA